MKRKKPQAKPATIEKLETFGGPYHYFESVFQPKTSQSTRQQEEKKQGRGKGKGRKSA